MQFVEVNLEDMLSESKSIVEKILGRSIGRADPLMLFLEALLSIILQQKVLINDLANQNLLAYARGDALEEIGKLVGVKRLPATAATCTVEVTLSAPRNVTTIIKSGTRFNAGNDINFALNDAVIFGAGDTVETVGATCLNTGNSGNGFKVGEINKIVDPQPYLKTITNITASEGGADIEDDESLRERIRIAPESFSVAGPAGAYIFFAKQVSADIIDVAIDSPAAGCVDVYILMKDGQLPQTEMLSKVTAALSEESVRPLTDFVTVKAPGVVSYNVELEYQILRTKQAQALDIIEKAEAAVKEYVLWQKSEIGRDIEPSELIGRMKNVGVDHVKVISPVFTEVNDFDVAVASDVQVVYRGLKDK